MRSEQVMKTELYPFWKSEFTPMRHSSNCKPSASRMASASCCMALAASVSSAACWIAWLRNSMGGFSKMTGEQEGQDQVDPDDAIPNKFNDAPNKKQLYKLGQKYSFTPKTSIVLQSPFKQLARLSPKPSFRKPQPARLQATSYAVISYPEFNCVLYSRRLNSSQKQLEKKQSFWQIQKKECSYFYYIHIQDVEHQRNFHYQNFISLKQLKAGKEKEKSSSQQIVFSIFIVFAVFINML